ncbi:MAG: deoxyribonuclease IV [Candidatus Woesearchaeota archaeon]|jgi:deoxyribonuclease-4|nr:deoxyribonuclease IV [Candidatus Woesearchaeota archaeon]
MVKLSHLGFHISRPNNLFNEIIEFSNLIGCNAIQVFLKSSLHNFDVIDEYEFLRVKNYVLKNEIFLIGHGALNLAKNYSNNLDEIYLFVLDMYKISALGGKGIILHIGKEVDSLAFENIKMNVDYILENIPKDLYLVLENTPGSKGDLGYDLEGIKKVYNLFSDEQKKRIRFCLDTCHFFVSGYDLSKFEFIEKWFFDIERNIGYENLFCIHLNDARNEFNSKIDGHREIGYGNIGVESLKKIGLFFKKRNIPLILETSEKNLIYKDQFEMINDWDK